MALVDASSDCILSRLIRDGADGSQEGDGTASPVDVRLKRTRKRFWCAFGTQRGIASCRDHYALGQGIARALRSPLRSALHLDSGAPCSRQDALRAIHAVGP